MDNKTGRINVQLLVASTLVNTQVIADYWVRNNDTLSCHAADGVLVAEFRLAEVLGVGIVQDPDDEDDDIVLSAVGLTELVIGWYHENQAKNPSASTLLAFMASEAWGSTLDVATDRIGEKLADLTIADA